MSLNPKSTLRADLSLLQKLGYSPLQMFNKLKEINGEKYGNLTRNVPFLNMLIFRVQIKIKNFLCVIECASDSSSNKTTSQGKRISKKSYCCYYRIYQEAYLKIIWVYVKL